jgi:NDP-sugar pyrophosphorylase family protein
MCSYQNGLKAVLLVGGLGTRLRSVVSSAPKPMAVVGDRPFLELLLKQLSTHNIRRLVLCTGYRADDIESELRDGSSWGASIEYSKELYPLGTAGAIKNARSYLLDVSDFLVMNGDSFMEVDFDELVRVHRDSQALATMVVTRRKNEMRYGTVEVEESGRVRGFLEKTSASSTALVNAGVYIFKSSVLDYIPDGPGSLERDIFPKLVCSGVQSLEQKGLFIDIGTPEDYTRAQALCDQLYQAASVKTRPDVEE